MSTAPVSFPSVLRDPQLLGGVFGKLSFKLWVCVGAVLFGLGHGLTPDEQQLVSGVIGGRAFPRRQVLEAFIVVSRRGGKSVFIAALVIYLSAFCRYELAPGEVATAILLCPTRRQAAILKRYISGLLSASPVLRGTVADETADTITLTNDVVIEVVTANRVAPRGRTLICVIVDEGSFLPTDEAAAEPLSEVLNACRPGLATTGGPLIVVSSPYRAAGPVYDACREHYGQDSPVLVVKGTSQQFNPTIPSHVVERALHADEAAARAEWLGEFRKDLEDLLSHDAIQRVTVAGRVQLAPVAGVEYTGLIDFAGGSGSDSGTLGIAHNEVRPEGRAVAVLDGVWEVTPPFSPAATAAEFAGICRRYGISVVCGDRYAGSWPAEQLRKHGVEFVPVSDSKSALYLALLPMVNSGAVELVDHARLRAQLAGLVRRAGANGRDQIDHQPGRHDDVANAAAGALVLAAREGADADEPLLLSFPVKPVPVLTDAERRAAVDEADRQVEAHEAERQRADADSLKRRIGQFGAYFPSDGGWRGLPRG